MAKIGSVMCGDTSVSAKDSLTSDVSTTGTLSTGTLSVGTSAGTTIGTLRAGDSITIGSAGTYWTSDHIEPIREDTVIRDGTLGGSRMIYHGIDVTDVLDAIDAAAAGGDEKYRDLVKVW